MKKEEIGQDLWMHLIYRETRECNSLLNSPILSHFKSFLRVVYKYIDEFSKIVYICIDRSDDIVYDCIDYNSH